MRPILDPALLALTGSETRALTLAPIANSSVPLSAYRIASIVQLARTKVYRELDKLARSGVVQKTTGSDGTALWSIRDTDIKQLFRRRARIGWSEDLSTEARALEKRTKAVLAFAKANPIDPALLAKQSKPRNATEFDRSPEKDAVLERLGLAPANRSSVK